MRSMKCLNGITFSKSIVQGVEVKVCRSSPHAFKAHVHHELSLGFLLEGSTDLTLRDTTLRYKKGDGVIIPPGVSHLCAPNDVQHWAYVMLFVDPVYYEGRTEYLQPLRLIGQEAKKLKHLIERLLEEKEPDVLENILIDLLLSFGTENEMRSSVQARFDDPCSVGAIRSHIASHVTEAISLEELEALSGMNRFSIIRQFKKQYQTTPSAYHLQNRVAEAKRQLADGVPLLDVCTRFHFYDQAHFIREFRKMYGITPGTYLRQVKQIMD